VLLVDDVEVNREIVMVTLEESGIKFECAVNGVEAIELYKTNPGKFEIILMDINMPEMDGVEATRQIRAMEKPGDFKIPIIALTANTSPADVKNYLAAGMNDHIGKPVDFNEILGKIRMYVRR